MSSDDEFEVDFASNASKIVKKKLVRRVPGGVGVRGGGVEVRGGGVGVRGGGGLTEEGGLTTLAESRVAEDT